MTVLPGRNYGPGRVLPSEDGTPSLKSILWSDTANNAEEGGLAGTIIALLATTAGIVAGTAVVIAFPDAYPVAAQMIFIARYPACPAVLLRLVEEPAGAVTAFRAVQAGVTAPPAVAVVVQREVDTLPAAAGLTLRAHNVMAAAVVFIACRFNTFAVITDLRADAGLAACATVVVICSGIDTA